MAAKCNPIQTNLQHLEPISFSPCGRRDVVAQFDGSYISSDGGALLLSEVEKRTNVLRTLTGCFTDYRDPDWIEHSVEELLRQRVYSLALGYEYLNDHDQLRYDQLLAAAVGKKDPNGHDRRSSRDYGKALAGKSTLNRLELTPKEIDGDKKIVADQDAMDDLLVDVYTESYRKAPKRVWLDVDATDDLIHGQQKGRFFHGYYGNYCYLPLYIFAGDHLLCGRLRQSDIDAAEGVVEELDRIVNRIRPCWPKVEVVIRGDSGFCREELMTWCEDNHHRYVLGLAKMLAAP